MMKEVIDHIYEEQYRKRIRRNKRFILIWQIVICILFFTLWEGLSHFRLIDPLIFSSPSKIMTVMYAKVTDGTIMEHGWITLIETIIGFLAGTLAGIAIATALWLSETTAKIADPYLVIFNAMPKVALGPIIIVALGPGYFSIIMMGAIIAVIITALVVYNGFMEVDANYVKVLRSFGATRWQCFKEAIFPATLPTMISTLKVNVGLSWVGVIVGEFLVSDQGLGYLIIYGFQVFDFTLVMLSLVIIAVCAAVMYKLVEKMESWLMKHTR